MRRPLFVLNDRRFVRDCCGEHAVYIDPTDALQAAKAIEDWYSVLPEVERARRINSAYYYVLKLPDGKERAHGYMEIIRKELNCYF
ncbi:MAG: hypothetical protein V9G23_01565 [Giesbergeria sp.]